MKKKVVALLLCFSFLISMFSGIGTVSAAGNWTDQAAASFGIGDGSKDSPYQISNAGQLAKLAADVNSGTNYDGKYFVLKDDIDLSGSNWVPIGNVSDKYFAGHFDGNGHMISNLNIASGSDAAGLFGYAGNPDTQSTGVIKNIILGQGTIAKGTTYTGAVIAYSNQTSGEGFNNLINLATSITGASGDLTNVGAVIGAAKILDENAKSYSEAATYDIKGQWAQYYGEDDYSSIIGGSVKVDGVANNNLYPVGNTDAIITAQKAALDNEYSGDPSLNTEKANLDKAAKNAKGGITLSRLFINSADGTGVIDDYSYAFAPILAAVTSRSSTVSSSGQPSYNTEEKTYTITSAQELAWVAEQVNGGTTFEGETIKLNGPISLPDNSYWVKGTGTFVGTFDGAGNTISGLALNADGNVGGLFYKNTGTIKNLTVSGTIFGTSATASAAGLVYQNTGTILNCTNSVNLQLVNNTTTTNLKAAGIAVENTGTILKGINNGKVIVSARYRDDSATVVPNHTSYAAGIVVTNNGKLQDCENNATVQAWAYNGASDKNSLDYDVRSAGIVVNQESGNVIYCSNNAEVYGHSVDNTFSNTHSAANFTNKLFVGGVSAYATGGNMIACFNSDKVGAINYRDYADTFTVDNYKVFVGGIAGYISTSGGIYGSYNAADLSLTAQLNDELINGYKGTNSEGDYYNYHAYVNGIATSEGANANIQGCYTNNVTLSGNESVHADNPNPRQQEGINYIKIDPANTVESLIPSKVVGSNNVYYDGSNGNTYRNVVANMNAALDAANYGPTAKQYSFDTEAISPTIKTFDPTYSEQKLTNASDNSYSTYSVIVTKGTYDIESVKLNGQTELAESSGTYSTKVYANGNYNAVIQPVVGDSVTTSNVTASGIKPKFSIESVKIGDANYTSGTWTNKDVVFTLKNDSTVEISVTPIKNSTELTESAITIAAGKTGTYTVSKNTNTPTAGDVYKFMASASNQDKNYLDTQTTVKIDAVAPTGTITLTDDNNILTALANKFTFGLFFKQTQTVTIAATAPAPDENNSPIAKTEYVQVEVTSEQAPQDIIDDKATVWKDYTQTFTISTSNNQAVIARFTDEAGNVGYVSTKDFSVDLTNPEVTITNASVFGNNWLNATTLKDVSVSVVEANALKSIAYVFDESQEGESSGTVAVEDVSENKFTVPTSDLANGTHTLKVTVTDKAGNAGTASLTIKVDKATPSATVTIKDNVDESNTFSGVIGANLTLDKVLNKSTIDVVAGAQESGTTISYAIVNNATTEMTKDSILEIVNNDWTEYSSSQKPTITEEGSYTVAVKVVSGSGVENIIVTDGFEIDTTVPTVAISNKTDFANWINENKDVSVTVADANSLSSITYKFDSEQAQTVDVGSVQNGKFTISTSSLADGTHTLVVTVTDIVGNSTETEELTIKIDKEAPTGTVSIDEVNKWTSLANSLTFGLFFNTEKAVTIDATDVTSQVNKTYYYIVENPESMLNESALKALADNAWTEYDSNNKHKVNTHGERVVYAKLVDNARNVKYISTEGFVYDAEKPVVDIEAVTVTGGQTYNSGEIINDTVKLTISNSNTSNIGDYKISYTLQKDDGSADPQTNDASNSIEVTSPAEDGTHTYVYTFTITSAAGTASDPVSFTVKRSTELPVVNITSTKQSGGQYKGGQWSNEDVILTVANGNHTDGVTDTIKYKVDGGSEQTYTGPITVSETGKYEFTISTSAGSSSEASSIQVNIDKTNPEISGVINNETYYGSRDIKVSDKNLSSVTVNGVSYYDANVAEDLDKLDPNAQVPTLPFTLNNAGDYTIVAKDTANNETTCIIKLKEVSDIIADIEAESNMTTEKMGDYILQLKGMLEDSSIDANTKAELKAAKDKLVEDYKISAIEDGTIGVSLPKSDVSVDSIDSSVLAGTLTEEDVIFILEGGNVNLEVEVTDNVPAADKDAITKAYNSDRYSLEKFFDITVNKIRTDANGSNKSVTEVTSLNKEITFKVDISKLGIDTTDNNVYIVRLHNGKVEKLSTKDLGKGVYSFLTSEFSTYAILLEAEEESQNGGDSNTNSEPEDNKNQGSQFEDGKAESGNASPTGDLTLLVEVLASIMILALGAIVYIKIRNKKFGDSK